MLSAEGMEFIGKTLHLTHIHIVLIVEALIVTIKKNNRTRTQKRGMSELFIGRHSKQRDNLHLC